MNLSMIPPDASVLSGSLHPDRIRRLAIHLRKTLILQQMKGMGSRFHPRFCFYMVFSQP
jgi:hypothetical protein